MSVGQSTPQQLRVAMRAAGSSTAACRSPAGRRPSTTEVTKVWWTGPHRHSRLRRAVLWSARNAGTTLGSAARSGVGLAVIGDKTKAEVAGTGRSGKPLAAGAPGLKGRGAQWRPEARASSTSGTCLKAAIVQCALARRQKRLFKQIWSADAGVQD